MGRVGLHCLAQWARAALARAIVAFFYFLFFSKAEYFISGLIVWDEENAPANARI